MIRLSAFRTRWGALGASGPILVVRTMALGASFLSVLIISRAVGPEGRGAIAASAILLLFGALGAGCGTGAAMYVHASRRLLTTPALVGVLISWSFVVFGLALMVGSLVLWLGWLDQWIPGAGARLVWLLAGGAACQYAALSSTQLLIGLGRRLSTAAGFGLVPLALLLGNVAAAIFTTDPIAFIVVQVLAWATGAGLLLLLIGSRPTFGIGPLREVLTSGRRGWLGDVANVLSYRLDALLLGLISGVFAVGLYSFAVQVLEPVWIVAAATSTGFLVENRLGVPEAERRRRTIRTATLVSAGAAVGLTAILVALPLLVTVVGREFDGSFVPALLLAPGILFLSTSKILAAYQLSHGRLWLGSLVAGLSVVTITIGDLLLMPSLGAAGAALASTIGYAVSATLWVVLYRHYRTAPEPIVASAVKP